MHYDLCIEQQPGYLHARAVGEHNRDNVLRFLVDAGRACVERNCRALLLELGLKGPSLHAGVLFQMIIDRAPEGEKCGQIAYVDASAERSPDSMKFVETVARSRGVDLRYFRSIGDAAAWLKAQRAAA